MIGFLEWTIFLAGLVAGLGTVRSLLEAIRQRWALHLARINSDRSAMSTARIVRDVCRVVAAWLIVSAGAHILTYETVISPLAWALKVALAGCAVAMAVTVGVDLYCRHRVQR